MALGCTTPILPVHKTVKNTFVDANSTFVVNFEMPRHFDRLWVSSLGNDFREEGVIIFQNTGKNTIEIDPHDQNLRYIPVQPGQKITLPISPSEGAASGASLSTKGIPLKGSLYITVKKRSLIIVDFYSSRNDI